MYITLRVRVMYILTLLNMFRKIIILYSYDYVDVIRSLKSSVINFCPEGSETPASTADDLPPLFHRGAAYTGLYFIMFGARFKRFNAHAAHGMRTIKNVQATTQYSERL